MPESFSLCEAYAGKRVLLTGATGFLGKVWLALALDRLSSVARIYVLIRPRQRTTGRERLEQIIGHTPVFERLHRQHGARLGEFVSQRVEVLEGDIESPQLGLEPRVVQRLQSDLDLVLHCAGRTDFGPDLRAALRTNVEGALNVALFANACEHAKLVHVSTCYVAGQRAGDVAEELIHAAPNGRGHFDPQAEYAEAKAAIDQATAELKTPSVIAEIEQRVRQGAEKRGLDATDVASCQSLRERYQQKWLKVRMVQEGERRAKAWGWVNTYTYTKALAESSIAARFPPDRYTIFRPAIIESALRYPFPGWNDGCNTSGPLAYVLGTWFRHYPARAPVPFDVVPVDLVVNGLTIAGAALMRGEHAPVYQCGTSVRNPLTMGRAVELTSLGHRRFLMAHGKNTLERQVLSRWDSCCVQAEHPLRMQNLEKGASWLSRLIAKVPEGVPRLARQKADQYVTMANNLSLVFGQIGRMLEAYKPFIYDAQYRFVADALSKHQIAERDMRFEPEVVDWRDYWVNIHMEGLRRWVFPELEGREPERYEPSEPFELPERRQRGEATRSRMEVRV